MLDTIENFNFRDKINKVLKTTYSNIDNDEVERYSSWKSKDFRYFSFEERNDGEDYDSQ